MAITRAQQYRQMLKEGSKKPAMQGGGPNYLGKQPEVTTPRRWKSSPDHPDTELAYITEPEKQVLIALNMHGGLEDGKPNKGPNNIPSLQGDLGGYDASPGGPNDPGSGGSGPGGRVGQIDKNKQRAADIMTGRVDVTSPTGITEAYGGFQPNERQYDGIGDFYGNPTIGDRIGRGLSNLFSKTLLGRIASNFGPFNNKDFFDTKVKPTGINLDYDEYMKKRMAGEIDAYGNPIGSDDGDGQQIIFPQMTMDQALSTAEQESKEKKEPFQIAPRFAAEGGIMNTDVVGGEFDFESARQMYGLGKLVKKATRAVKKVVKSPIGKAALAYGLTMGIPGTEFKGIFGGGKGLGLKKFLFGQAGATGSMAGGGTLGVLGKLGLTTGAGSMALTGKGITAGILGTSALAGLMTPEEEEESQAELAKAYGEPLDFKALRPYGPLRFEGVAAANGGRIQYQEGSKEPVAKKTMPLLDMGGKEMDLREEGGFVPIGRMEKADDVPARLSKNEFVFTADAVRNAGDGNVDKGAEVMYNMMKNLEAGGDVSEESQGLEGARKMFQTSQRLEEVL